MAEEKPRQRMEMRLEKSALRGLIEDEAAMFNELKGKRVYVESDSNYTGVLTRHGVDFIELKDVRTYYNQASHEKVFMYENNEYFVNNRDYHGHSNSKIINKFKIEQICELGDISIG